MMLLLSVSVIFIIGMALGVFICDTCEDYELRYTTELNVFGHPLAENWDSKFFKTYSSFRKLGLEPVKAFSEAIRLTD